MKGLPFVNRRYTQEVPSLSKLIYKRVRGWTLQPSLPVKKLCWEPPGTSARNVSSSIPLRWQNTLSIQVINLDHQCFLFIWQLICNRTTTTTLDKILRMACNKMIKGIFSYNVKFFCCYFLITSAVLDGWRTDLLLSQCNRNLKVAPALVSTEDTMKNQNDWIRIVLMLTERLDDGDWISYDSVVRVCL